MWVLIDTSYLAHRARYSLKDLEFEDFPTGVIFGMFEQLLTICSNPKIKSNKVALFFDSNHSYRKKDYPEYKNKRHEDRTPEEWKRIGIMKDQLNILRLEAFPEIGFPCYLQGGLESDDLMAQFAEQIKGKGIIVTSDGDLFQCLTDRIHWYDPGRDRFMTPESFFAKKGCHASAWGNIKSLAGCNTDGVKGIPGVGEKTAIKYFDGELPTRYKAFKAIESNAGQSIILRNNQLVCLPHCKTKKIGIKKPMYKVERFIHYCKRFGLKSYLSEGKQEQWMNFFNGIFETRKVKSRKRGQRRRVKK